MASGATTVNTTNATDVAKPPLAMGVRLRLSVMMFLQFAVWGSFWTVLNIYCDSTLHFSKAQIGEIYSTMALGAIISMMFAGQLADRLISSEYLMAIFHIGGAILLFTMAEVQSFTAMYWAALGYALLYNPTLAIANAVAFHNIPDATRDFPSLRVLGTIGWIVAGVSVDFVLGAGAEASNKPLLMGAILSAVLGVFSLMLPHTPPSGKKGDAIPFLRAFGLLKDYSFGVFFGVSFAITIALAFYYNFAGIYLGDLGFSNTAAAASWIQIAAFVAMLVLPLIRAFDLMNDMWFAILYGIDVVATIALAFQNGRPGAATVQTFGQMSEIFFLVLLPFALKRFGMKGVLVVGMAAWAVRYGCFSAGHLWMGLVIIGVILHGVCFDFFLAAGFIHTDNKAPVAIRASAQALFSFLTYGVGMYIGNLIAGGVSQHFTTATGTDWTKVWLVPGVGAAVCLLIFFLLWRDKPGRVEQVDVVAETAGSPGDPDKVSQTIA